MPKFNFHIGDKVIYHRGQAAVNVGLSPDVTAKVIDVSTSYTTKEPLYTIEWLPTGLAIVSGNEISKAE